MSNQYTIVNPTDYPKWDEILLKEKEYSFFHSSYWAKVLSKTYGYQLNYFALFNDSKLQALLPFMEVKNFPFGNKGVSLPFTDYCEPIISVDISFQNIFNDLITYAKKKKWKYLELRGVDHFLKVSPSSWYYVHILDLFKDEGKIFLSFRGSTKRNIKKAVKEGVEVNISSSVESVKEFYRLNCITRKDHGLPPQPYNFFLKIYDYVISKNHGFVVLATYNKKIIAGALYFHFGEKAIYKYGASDKDYQHLRANNLIMWEAIKWYLKNGYKKLCFGKTEPDNKGLLQFKNGWGTKEKKIKYFKYDLNEKSFVKGDSYVSGFHNKLFKRVPVFLLKIFSNIFYKYAG